MRRIVAIALCTAGLVALTGPAAGAAEELTKAEFITAADKLCKDTDDFLFYVTLNISSKGTDPNAPPTDAMLEEFSQYLVYSYRGLIADIRDLQEPKADRAAIKKLLKTLSKEITAIEDDPLVLRTGELMPKTAKLAKRYGFTACGANS